jgi:predicted phage gp36 major capsid-like protein
VERLDKLEAKASRPNGGTEEKTEPTEERKAFAAYLRHGPSAPADTLKVLVEASDPQGGFLAPPEMSTEFLRDLVEYSPIRAYASVRQTTGAVGRLPDPHRHHERPLGGRDPDPHRERALLRAGGGRGERTRDLRRSLQPPSRRQRRPGGGRGAHGPRRGLRAEESIAFLEGDGILEPEGILTNTAIPATVAASATALAPDELISMMYSLPGPYRNRGAWAMNGTTLSALRKLKDAGGAYIWQPALTEGQPETILGRPIVEMVDLPDIGAGATAVLYGDWSGYRIVDRIQMSILVDPYTRATNGITRIHATRRVGGAVLQPKKFRRLTMAGS